MRIKLIVAGFVGGILRAGPVVVARQGGQTQPDSSKSELGS